MRWFKHQSNSSTEGQFIAALEDKFGLEGYARYFKLLEIVALKMEDDDDFSATYPMEKWRTFLKAKQNKLDSFLVYLENQRQINLKRTGNLLTIEIPKMLELRDEYTRKKTESLRTKSHKIKEIDTEQEEVKAKASTSTPDPQELQQQIFENSQPIKQTGGETEQGLDLILIRPDKTKQNEVEWLMQNLIHHVRSGRNGKTQLHDGSLAGFVGVHPEAKKLLYEWKRHGPAERMAAIALAANSPTATNELKYALAAIKNRYDGYVSNLKTTETAIASGDKEIEL